MSTPEESLSIGDVVAATGVREATLRAWERRYGFPSPRREASGHRRYGAAEVERIRRVVRERDAGISLALAIERAKSVGPGPLSMFARLRERRPDLQPMRIHKRQMIHLSRAVEDESAARAEPGLLIGSFQEDAYYRRSEERWRRLSRGCEVAFAVATFGELRRPEGGPVEVPVTPADPIASEWGVVVLAPGFSACLLGWEAPPSGPEDDAERTFEAILSVEPAVVRESAAAAAAIAAPIDPGLAAATRSQLEGLVDADPESQLRLAGAITARTLATLG
jgi:DNA-binding transcriptional MerR regulator